MGTATLIRPLPISQAHSRLSLLFSAQLFNAVPALSQKQEEKEENVIEEDLADSREFNTYSNLKFIRERTFRMWINSLSLPNVAYLTNLFNDITDGLVLLRLLDHIQPGSVNWDKV